MKFLLREGVIYDFLPETHQNTGEQPLGLFQLPQVQLGHMIWP